MKTDYSKRGAVGALVFLAVSLFLLLLITGCGKTINGERKSRTDMENEAITKSLRTVEYNGHSYIVYREVYGTKNFGGITHDPECGCEEIEYYGCEVIKFCSCEEGSTIQ